MIQVSVKLSDGFLKKTDESLFKQCIEDVISNVTLEAESRCRIKSPYATGNLRRCHSSDIHSMEGRVTNSAEYATYVIHGTSRMSPRNYPLEVCNELHSERYISKHASDSFAKRGLL